MGHPKPVEGPAKTSWRAKAAMKDCAVYQLVWTVYVHGKKYFLVFHMVSHVAPSQQFTNSPFFIR